MIRRLVRINREQWVYGDFIIKKITRTRVTELDKYEVTHHFDGQHYGSFLALAEAVNEIDKLYLKNELNDVNHWLEKKPFTLSANAIICMYQARQEVSNEKAPANSPSEIEWACTQLFYISHAAAYAGSEESQHIQAAAEYWKLTGNTPQLLF